MRIRSALLALVAVSIPSFAADYTLELTPEATKVHFTVADPLHTVRGAFNLQRGVIGFNPDTGHASGQVVVDVASGNSGSDARDSRMHANVLESKKFPEAVFAPRRIEGTLALQGASTVKLDGTLSIHGVAHEITAQVQATVTSYRIRATIAFDIPYVAWGMKDPSNFLLKVGKTVQMTIETAGLLEGR